MVDIGGVFSSVTKGYTELLSSLPGPLQSFVNLFLLVVLIVVYCVFIWKLYRFIAKKNIFELDLNQYNQSEHPGLSKVIASAFYLLEYVIILPFLIFFWFAIFTIFLVLLTNNLELHTILIISVTIISAVRMTAYIPGYGEDLAKEIAKLLPFTLLAVSLLNPGFFDFEMVLSNLSELSVLSGTIFNYLLFIVVLEVVLRFFEFLFGLLGMYDIEEEPENKKK